MSQKPAANPVLRGGDLVAAIARIGAEVAAPAAADVDAKARFPREALGALCEVKALGASLPSELGGAGATVTDLARMCAALGQHCASSAMIFAMHHIQVLCLLRHGASNPELSAYLGRLSREQRLVASATSEVGPGGDLRRSVCAVQLEGGCFSLEKQASVISYGAHARDLLISARRGPKAVPGDQVLVLALENDYELANSGSWDTLGMRGTCSPGAKLRVCGEAWQILPEAFGDIASTTMVPTSHILWSACWLGIAADAVSKARAMVHRKARAKPSVVPRAAQRLAQSVLMLQSLEREVMSAAHEYDELIASNDRAHLSSVTYGLRINNLKLAASRQVVDIVNEALAICGVEGYRNDSPLSLGRNLRDAHSAALMIHNDRIVQSNESLLLVHKGA